MRQRHAPRKLCWGSRIRALNGEQIVVGNTELLKQPVKNYRRMQERRIAFTFGITYDTPPALVEAIPGIVKALVDGDDMLRFDRAHFHAFGPPPAPSPARRS